MPREPDAPPFQPADATAPLRVLWIATKTAWPPIDGGRALMAATLDALAAAGVALTFVAPTRQPAPTRTTHTPAGVRLRLVHARPRAWLHAAWRSRGSGRPVGIERHVAHPVAHVVADLVRRDSFDVVCVEQLQAWANAGPAIDAGVASVLRAQNVESDLWSAAAGASPRGAILRAEARRLRRFEADTLAAADATIALCARDAARLSALSPPARVAVVPPPAPPHWRVETGAAASTPAGALACTWIGSPGWRPNDDGVRWLLEEIWPAIAARVPGARLEVFGRVARATGHRSRSPAAEATITRHPAPTESGMAFAAGTVLLLPMRTAGGVRLRLVEAWARGVPVIASPAAVDGLDAVDGRNVLIAADPRGFAEAAAHLAAQPDLRTRLARDGRATVARGHDAATIARATIAVFRAAIAHRRRRLS